MRRTGWSFIGVLALGLGSMLGGCRGTKPVPAPLVLPHNATSGQALVVEVRGFGVRGRNPGGSWKKLLLGDRVGMGGTVETAPDSAATLRLYESGITLHLKPGSLVRLEKLVSRGDAGALITVTLLDLQKGEVSVDASQLSPGSEFDIRTPQGVTRIPPAARN